MCACPGYLHVPHAYLSPVYLQHVQVLSVSILFVYLFMPPTYSPEDLRVLTRIHKIQEEPIN